MAINLLWMMLAGAAGAAARWGLASVINRGAGGLFPWGTLVVNAIGCLLFGVVFAVTANRLPMAQSTRLIVLTGFLGAFTTFSTFAFESVELMEAGRPIAAGANVVGQTLGGLVLVSAGLWFGRWIAT